MDLIRTQRWLARLYTDEALRERFVADPHEAGRHAGLSSSDVDALAQTSPLQLQRFARALQRKRINELRTALPLTSRVLGERFFEVYRRFASDGGAQASSRRTLARRFLSYARRCEFAHRRATWIREVMQFEADRLDAGGVHVIVRVYRYPVHALARELLAGKPPGRPRSRLTLCVWVRIPGRDAPRHAVISMPHLMRLPE